MKKLGVFVGENGLLTFFREIYADLSSHFNTSLFQYKTYHPPILKSRYNYLKYQQQIRQIMRSSDVCFFEWASDLLETASKMPKTVPIITRLHSFELYDWAPKINWTNVDKIILISQTMQSKFIAEYPEQAAKTTVIYNAVPIDKFTPEDRPFDFSIGMLCAIDPIKRIYEAILVIKELVDLGYNPTLHIAGGRKHKHKLDRYYAAIYRLIEKLALKDRVILYGQVSDPAAWLKNIDIFISNSYWEGMQTALLEAMATGCYCLTHFWDGAEEALPPENIYSTDTGLKQKLIDYSQLSTAEKTAQKNLMREIASIKFNLESNITKIREVVNAFV